MHTMKKSFAALIAVALLAACDPSLMASKATTHEVAVTGTPGLTFSGSIGTLGDTRTVEGTVPATFSVTPDKTIKVVSAVIQKKEEAGTLTVEIRSVGQTVKTGTTTAEFGLVNISHTF